MLILKKRECIRKRSVVCRLARIALIVVLFISILLTIALLAYISRFIIAEKTWQYMGRFSNYPPRNEVRLDSTNLPILFVSAPMISKDDYVETYMTIVYNGEGKWNYADTVSHQGQNIDYQGSCLLKYRGHSSYTDADKKSYSLRTMNCSLDNGGRKKGVSLLGLEKDSKYVLKANYLDRSMLRETLTFELARKYLDYVPSMRYCEMILNGKYYGLYVLMEQPTRKRLGIRKKTGSLLYFVRPKESDETIEIITASKDTLEFSYEMKYPKYMELDEQSKKKINEKLKSMVNAFDGYSSFKNKCIDEMSFIDYQLSTEFSHNIDGYWFSAYVYDQGESTSRFKMTLWDVDHSFGIDSDFSFGNYDNFVYCDLLPYNPGFSKPWWQQIQLRKSSSYRQQLSNRSPKKWWEKMMQDSVYREKLSNRWKQCRNEYYSVDSIVQIVDSLADLMTVGGAMNRNTRAWETWGNSDPLYLNNVKYHSDSFQDEVQYIKEWIDKRLIWMDKQLFKVKQGN